jgi:hypothetical protein
VIWWRLICLGRDFLLYRERHRGVILLMNRLILGTALLLASVFLLTGCTSSDPFSARPAGTDNSEAPVAGAGPTPAPESSNGGWAW